MTRCPSCQNENADGVPYCDLCGFDLAPSKRAPVAEAAPSPGQPPAHPHQKRHTVFEPESAPPPPGARKPDDYFSRPPPPRPPLDPRDPFGAAMAPPPAPAPRPVPAAPGVDVRAQKARTIVEGHAAEPSGGPMVRAALFEYRGPTDTGRVHPLRAGRNVIGRNEDCDVVVQDGRVSGQHAFVFVRAEDATFVDVSSNGSVVNGTAVHGEQVVLQNHAVLGLGGTTLVLALIPEQVLARRSR